MPDGCAVNEAKTANKVIFISLNSNVYTDQFSSELSTRLLNRERFTITRETRDKRRVEYTGLNNFFNITEIAKLDEGIIFLRDKVLFDCRHCSRCLEILLQFFLDSQVPLTTTNFELIEFLVTVW